MLNVMLNVISFILIFWFCLAIVTLIGSCLILVTLYKNRVLLDVVTTIEEQCDNLLNKAKQLNSECNAILENSTDSDDLLKVSVMQQEQEYLLLQADKNIENRQIIFQRFKDTDKKLDNWMNGVEILAKIISLGNLKITED